MAEGQTQPNDSGATITSVADPLLPSPTKGTDSSSSNEHKCSVCLELFTDPKVLPCCHTFCLECLKKTATREKTRGQITCPKCRESHVIPEGGLSEFLTDFMTNYEIEVKSVSSKNAKDTVCGECEQSRPISHFCSDCRNYLCEECGLELHKRLKIYRDHKVVPISEISVATFQSSKVYFCQLHEGESLKLYCETCKKLVCRDCILVDHRHHSYKFVQDARKQVTAEMMALKSKIEKKLIPLKHNLQEVNKFETAATGYPHVLKADINAFFDGLVRSIEARRAVLLQEADSACQRDLKQVWADKVFHETMISHISAVFGLVDKALKCTNSSEMILTALQSIDQLKMVAERDWDESDFTTMVLSTPSFNKGEKLKIDAIGDVSCTSFKELKLRKIGVGLYYCTIGSKYRVEVTCSGQDQRLIDKRSGRSVNLQLGAPQELNVVVKYGLCKRKLDTSNITITATVTRKKVASELKKVRSTKEITTKKSISENDVIQVYEVKIQPVCSGEHTVFIIHGSKASTQSFTVEGKPNIGDKLRKGPDWKRADPPVTDDDGVIGTVDSQFRHSDSEDEGEVKVDDRDMLCVINKDKQVSYYKWGKDEEYEVELAL